jgi:hypothetical protein
MNIQDLRDIVAQINAAHPTQNGDFPLLLESKDGWLTITFMTYDDIKIRLHHHCAFEEDWVAIAQFYELSNVAWNLSDLADHYVVSIAPSNGKLNIESVGSKTSVGYTSDWLEDVHIQMSCLFMNFSDQFMRKKRKLHVYTYLDKLVWKAEETLEALEDLFFDEEEFEAYHEVAISGGYWFHLQGAALVARQNEVRKKAKYPVLCGINISAVNNNLEISAMCPTSTTFRLLWEDVPYWEHFSFTIPSELVDQISQAVDTSMIDSVVFFVNPELIKVKVLYTKRIVDNGQAALMGAAYFFVKPVKGRYFYPKVPVNQMTEKSVAVSKLLLEEAISSAGKGSRDPQCNEVIIQVQDEKLLVHGRKNSFQVDAADCIGVADAEIRICGVKFLDLLKYTQKQDAVLLLDFPAKLTQALMVRTFSDTQYLVFGLVKGDRVISSEMDIKEQLLTIPGICPGEPDVVLQLFEELILEPPLPEADRLYSKENLLQIHSRFGKDREFTMAIDEMYESLIDARNILEECPPCPEMDALIQSLRSLLDDHEGNLADYEAGHTEDLYCHGGLNKEALEVEVELKRDIANLAKLLAGRVQEVVFLVEKTYSVRMTFV